MDVLDLWVDFDDAKPLRTIIHTDNDHDLSSHKTYYTTTKYHGRHQFTYTPIA